MRRDRYTQGSSTTGAHEHEPCQSQNIPPWRRCPAELPGRLLDLGGGGAGLPRTERLEPVLSSFVGVWLLKDAWLAVRGGGTGERSRVVGGDLPGEAESGVGTASAGIAGGCSAAEDGIGGTAGIGVREREGVEAEGMAGDRERTGVDAGV